MREQPPLAQLVDRWHSELATASLRPAGDAVPGDEKAVVGLERRIERQLPPSYREFLLQCNGMPVTGALTAGLRSAQRTGWFRDLEPEWLQAKHDASDDPDDPGHDVELMQRALLVSEPGDQALLLDPDQINATTGEWACYTFSNFAPGSNRIGMGFRSGLEYVYRQFLSAHPVASITLDDDAKSVEHFYQATLAGDISRRDRLEALVSTNWRAWLLAAQFDTFGAKPRTSGDKSVTINHLWWGYLGGVSEQLALTDPVLINELIPLFVVRLIESGTESHNRVEFEANRAPTAVAERMRCIFAAINDGTGPIADFSYSPTFSEQIVVAREQLLADQLDAAWNTVRAALSAWRPMTSNHLAPTGLYYDKDLRRLLTLAPQRPPQHQGLRRTSGGQIIMVHSLTRPENASPSRPSITPLPARKQHSERTLAILTAGYSSPT